MTYSTSTDRAAQAARITREQAEVAAVLGRARQGRVDETAVLAAMDAAPTRPSPERDTDTAAAPAPATGTSTGSDPAPTGPPAWPAPTGAWAAPSGAPRPPGTPASTGAAPQDSAGGPGQTGRSPHGAAGGPGPTTRYPYARPSTTPGPPSPIFGGPGGPTGPGRPSDPTGPGHPTGPGGPGRPADRRRRPGWVALTGTAATAALLASLGTATFTGAFDEPLAPASTVEQPQAASAVPVSATAQQPDWQAVAAAVRESVVAIAVQTASGNGSGSGVVLDGEGHVLTNSHVVDGAQNGTVGVTLGDGRMYEARIVGQDETTDLAVLALVDAPDDLVPATFGSSSDLAVGEPVAAVGNPLGLDSTVTTGIISALDRPVVTQSRSAAVVTNAIQVDAAINPGNSGGPLFNARGEVIGITSSIATLSGGSASGSIGLGFAIPIDQASGVADQLVTDGTVEHAFLGVGLADATATADGTTRQGAEVRQVENDSPAAAAGLRTGDVITAVDGRSVDSAASLTGYVRQHDAGDRVTLTVIRNGATEEIPTTLATR